MPMSSAMSTYSPMDMLRQRQREDEERRQGTTNGDRRLTSWDSRRRSRSPSSQDRRRRRARSGDRGRSEDRGRKRSRGRSEEKSRSKSKKRKKSKKKKSKKSKKRSSSSSSSSSESSEEEQKQKEHEFLKRIEMERVKALEEKRRRKEALKANETPEEKRIRRLMKKEAKEKKKREKMGWDNEYALFTDADNPFGDAHLHQTFVWKKKLEKEGLADLGSEEIEERNRQKMIEMRDELEKVKARRQQYELEKAAREEESALEQRRKEAAQFREWEKQEDSFHLQQAKLRSKIRIQDGRAKPIDLLAKYISAEEDLDEVEMHEPYTYLNGLGVGDLEDLQEDIKVYKELDSGNLSFWNDMEIIVDDQLVRLRKEEAESRGQMMATRREGVHEAVRRDVVSIFKGKSSAQLDAMRQQMERKIRSGDESVDVTYWESLLSQLKAHMARTRLRERHQEGLKKKLERLREQQALLPSTSSAATEAPVEAPPVPEEEEAKGGPLAEREEEVGEEDEDELEEGEGDGGDDDPVKTSLKEYVSGSYSPKCVRPEELEPGTILIDPDEDFKRLEYARGEVLKKGKKIESVVTAEEKALAAEARKGMTDEEAQFSVEQDLGDAAYLWSDKYRPRKPRYFNRVHTGFEWNKYNQTHYDIDNPPPKIVQGYKFNIFYPDLIDKGTAPSYSLSSDEDNRDFAILRFTAGPPYEDIAFKIVNREWEYSYRKGFRCQFQNNIFQLWFHFKRYRYRR